MPVKKPGFTVSMVYVTLIEWHIRMMLTKPFVRHATTAELLDIQLIIDERRWSCFQLTVILMILP